MNTVTVRFQLKTVRQMTEMSQRNWPKRLNEKKQAYIFSTPRHSQTHTSTCEGNRITHTQWTPCSDAMQSGNRQNYGLQRSTLRNDGNSWCTSRLLVSFRRDQCVLSVWRLH